MLKTLTIAAVALTAVITATAASISPANAIACRYCAANGVSLNGISPQFPAINGAPVPPVELPPAPPIH